MGDACGPTPSPRWARRRRRAGEGEAPCTFARAGYGGSICSSPQKMRARRGRRRGLLERRRLRQRKEEQKGGGTTTLSLRRMRRCLHEGGTGQHQNPSPRRQRRRRLPCRGGGTVVWASRGRRWCRLGSQTYRLRCRHAVGTRLVRAPATRSVGASVSGSGGGECASSTSSWFVWPRAAPPAVGWRLDPAGILGSISETRRRYGGDPLDIDTAGKPTVRRLWGLARRVENGAALADSAPGRRGRISQRPGERAP